MRADRYANESLCRVLREESCQIAARASRFVPPKMRHDARHVGAGSGPRPRREARRALYRTKENHQRPLGILSLIRTTALDRPYQDNAGIEIYNCCWLASKLLRTPIEPEEPPERRI